MLTSNDLEKKSVTGTVCRIVYSRGNTLSSHKKYYSRSFNNCLWIYHVDNHKSVELIALLLREKVLQLDDRTRMKFKIKIAYMLGRINVDEIAAGLENPGRNPRPQLNSSRSNSPLVPPLYRRHQSSPKLGNHFSPNYLIFQCGQCWPNLEKSPNRCVKVAL
jgi:hypothetical protein